MNTSLNRLTWIGLLLGAALLFAPSFASAAGGGGDVPAPHVNWTDFGYKDKNVAGEKLGPNEEHMAPPLVAQLVNFSIFIGLLLLLAGPRIKKAMKKNHNEVKTALEEAATMKADAAAKLDEYKKRIAKVDKEVDDLVTTIKTDAEAERKRIIAEAEASAAALKRDAEERISATLGRARAELEAEVVAAAVAAAEGALRKQVGDTDQTNLVEQFIVSMESDNPSSPPGGGGGSSSPRGGGDGPSQTETKTTSRDKRESEVDEGWG